VALGANLRPADIAALEAGAHPQAAQRGTQRRLARPPNRAGYFAGATGRSFVLHIADELIHHTAEAALLRDLFAGPSVRA
jgi:hypothetical protein